MIQALMYAFTRHLYYLWHRMLLGLDGRVNQDSNQTRALGQSTILPDQP